MQNISATYIYGRINGIMTHAEANGREKLAASLALETDMSVDAASKVLAAQDKATAAKTPATPGIEQRAEGLNEFGAGAGAKPTAGAEADAAWAKAIKNVNGAA